MPVCPSSPWQLLHDEQSKHIMEVALNLKTDLEHYHKTLPELQKHNSELHNELCKSMPLIKYVETQFITRVFF